MSRPWKKRRFAHITPLDLPNLVTLLLSLTLLSHMTSHWLLEFSVPWLPHP